MRDCGPVLMPCAVPWESSRFQGGFVGLGLLCEDGYRVLAAAG
jgi:hypothetical protein